MKSLRGISSDPMFYVIWMSCVGAGLIISGVALMLGAGPAFVVAGLFLMGGAAFITRGMTGNG